MKNITKPISPRYENFMFDWNYETYVLLGGYGSGKSYHIALKLIFKCLEEKRKVLVVREVFDTIKESCYDLFCEILTEFDLLQYETAHTKTRTKVVARKSPLEFIFPNGSRIIFKGMDKPEKIKSINGVSIVWFEECSEIKYDAYKEVTGRIRTPLESMHFILSCNPVGRENWVYRHFFARTNEQGKMIVTLDEEDLYQKKTLVKNDVYYDHTVADDNPFLPRAYIARLEKIKLYDEYLYNVARLGRFGTSGTRVLPQLIVAGNADLFKSEIARLGINNQYFGFDFGFEESYNAVVNMSTDNEHGILYIWDEIYVNKMTDDKFLQLPKMQQLKKRLQEYNKQGYNKLLIADNADPKAITYYRQNGIPIRACRNKFAGSRLSNTRKLKRYTRIIVSPNCKNTIRELQDLTYKKDAKGNVIYDQFNIDPHTFSAMWYGLDTVTVADLKYKEYNSVKGGI